jgi:hypothetical protein
MRLWLSLAGLLDRHGGSRGLEDIAASSNQVDSSKRQDSYCRAKLVLQSNTVKQPKATKLNHMPDATVVGKRKAYCIITNYLMKEQQSEKHQKPQCFKTNY